MDAFYASVEQRDNPELQGKPVAVGGSKDRGVVAAASYEARRFGVKSAMSSSVAYKRCPEIVFVKPRFDIYQKVSEQIRAIFFEYTDMVEPLSLDEAYLDVTTNKMNIALAMDIAWEIKLKIKEQTGLVASAGVSYNKFLAKIASDFNKPDGYYVITPKKALEFMERLPIEKFFGIGKVTAEKMRSRNILYGLNLKKQTLDDLTKWFGKAGNYYYNVVRGVDNRVVNPDRVRKSIGAERTFDQDYYSLVDLDDQLENVACILKERVLKANKKGKTLTLKIKYADFTQITRSKTFPEFITQTFFWEIARELLRDVEHLNLGVRLVGLTLSNFEVDNNDQFLGQQMLLDY